MKVLAIIQARMGSSRLPNKVLLELVGKPVIQHVIERVKKSKQIDEVVVATSIEKNNLELINVCTSFGTRIFVGSENDVLDRFYQLAKIMNPEIIVRITADCPLIDAKLIDKVIEKYKSSNADYVNNKNFPDGMGCEVFSIEVLKKAWENAVYSSEREHVTPYIRKNMKLDQWAYSEDLFGERWTLDEPEDFEMINKVFEALYYDNPDFGIEEIKNFLNENQDVADINRHIGRDEGYAKSLKKDKIVIEKKGE